MPSSFGSAGYAGTRRVMIFIDGGYLRRQLTDMFGTDVMNYDSLANKLRAFTEHGSLFPELIRAYYYDAIPDTADKERYEKQQAYLRKIRDTDYFEIRLGRLKDSSKGIPKQKGVDTLIALDMLAKAYENHYDVGVLLAGDDDFLEVVTSVKDTGKRVFGAYFPDTISQALLDSFDKRFPLTQSLLSTVR